MNTICECDVLVVGGGTSGIVAALAAARNGAKTVLVERYGFLGGTLINGAVILHSFFNQYKAYPEAGKIQLVRGIAQEIVDRMVAAGGSLGHAEQEVGTTQYDPVITCIDHEMFKHEAFSMMVESDVKLYMHTLMTDVVSENGRIAGVVVENKSGRGIINAKVVIDTTGDADVAHRLGVKCFDLHKHMGVSMTFGLANIQPAKTLEFVRQYDGMLFQLARVDRGEGIDDIARLCFIVNKAEQFEDFVKAHPYINRPKMVCIYENNAAYVNVNGMSGINPVDADDLTRAEIELRKQISEIVAFFKENIPGFERCHLSWTADQACIRKSRIVDCEYDLTPEEIVDGTRFDDEIALFGYHDSNPHVMIKNGGFYGIPYRALLPKGAENLLVAGRLITTDPVAHNSTRNTVACMAEGQAAGTAAALAVQTGVPPASIDVQALRAQLRRDGAYLGEEV
jgi:hypothetical protein